MTGVARIERKRLETREERCALPPSAAGIQVIDHAPRCQFCDHPLAWKAARPWSIQCKWCRKTTNSPA